MDLQLPKLQTKTLRRARDSSAYKLYRAAQEWDLVDPILIRDRQDLKSEPKWHDHVEPYYHQISNLVTFCRRLPVTLLADDVGLGKTISAGLIASELMARHRVSKILVVCPKLLMPQWKEELETKFAIPGVEAVGNDLVKAKVPDVTQRPTELPDTALAQCGTIIALRLSNAQDQGAIRAALPDTVAGLAAVLPSLRTGEAVVSGEAVVIPARALLDMPDPKPQADDPSLAPWRREPQLPDIAPALADWRGTYEA